MSSLTESGVRFRFRELNVAFCGSVSGSINVRSVVFFVVFCSPMLALVMSVVLIFVHFTGDTWVVFGCVGSVVLVVGAMVVVGVVSVVFVLVVVGGVYGRGRGAALVKYMARGWRST